MASRALAFADPRVRQLLKTRFVPVADNSSWLQGQNDAEGRFFRTIAEQGHYGGRTQPSATRQGQYAATVDGTLLASINTREAEALLGMLDTALARWEQGHGRRRPLPVGVGDVPDPDARFRLTPPAGGLVLKAYARDLPRAGSGAAANARPAARNLDHVWITQEETAQLAAAVTAGRRMPLPAAVAWRLARFHLRDYVRGETPAWQPAQVRRLHVSLEPLAGEAGEMRLQGEVRCEAQGSWAVRPFREHTPQERGLDLRLDGRLAYDPDRQQFQRLVVCAQGSRWGGTEHNVRHDDLEPAPIGFLFERAGDAPRDRVPPTHGAKPAYLSAAP